MNNSNLSPAIPNQRVTWSHTRAASVVLPVIFALVYGSGFVGAKYGLPYCPPLTFLGIRFALAASLIALLAIALRAAWPSPREALHIAIAGLMTVAMFSVGVFVSINLGISPALSALIIALQPLLVAVLARRVVGEQVTPWQWAGLFLGFAGVAFVLGHKVRFDGASTFAVAMSVVGLIGVTGGNLYQKRFCSQMNLFTGGAIQSAASALAAFVLALGFERMTVQWTPSFVVALLYMAVCVSMGALTLLYIMIRRGDVSRVASVFYLVPVSAAASSFFIFGERFDAQVGIGVGIVAFGVLMVNFKPSRVRAS